MSNSSIWPTDKSRPRSNGNEGLLHIPQISRAGASLSDGLMLYPGDACKVAVLSLCKDAGGVFNLHSRQGSYKYYYQTLIILFDIDHLFAHRYFQLLLFNVSNSVYHMFRCNRINLHIYEWYQVTNYK